MKKLLTFFLINLISFSVSALTFTNSNTSSSNKSSTEEPLPEIADEKGYVIVLKEDFSKPFKYKKIKKNIYKYEYFYAK